MARPRRGPPDPALAPPAPVAAATISDPALRHVLTSVLGFADNSPAAQALALYGVNHIPDLLLLTDDDFANLRCRVDDEEVSLPPMVCRNLSLVQEWHRATFPMGATDTEWRGLTREVFDVFRVQRQLSIAPAIASVPPPSTASIPTESETFSRTTLEAYENLKDDKKWTEYHLHLRSCGTAQGLESVFDPETPTSALNFRPKNTFLYSVFTKTLKTTASTTILITHERTLDGRAVYLDLVRHYEQSHVAHTSAQFLRQQWQSLRHTADSKGTNQAFLDNWTKLLANIQNKSGSVETDLNKRTQLFVALKDSPDLKAVEDEVLKKEVTDGPLSFARFRL